eukprot:COSAG06_NODE_64483_length_259_cov_0.956250_2_plen_37_part_01
MQCMAVRPEEVYGMRRIILDGVGAQEEKRREEKRREE